MVDVQRGILVDAEGYFLGAFQWEKSKGPPVINRPRIGESKIRAEDVKHMLTSQDAIDGAAPNGRWSFVPKTEVQDVPITDEDGKPTGATERRRVRVSDGGWTFPNKRVWQLSIRRDKPDIGNLLGSRMIWPDRYPVARAGEAYTETAPPEWRGRKPVFRFSSGQWEFPTPKLVVNAQGEVIRRELQADEGDVEAPPGGAVIDEDFAVAADELGKVSGLELGDAVDMATRLVTKKVPKYDPMSADYFIEVITDERLLKEFDDHLSAMGSSRSEFLALGSVSFNSPVVRNFIKAQGLTMKQAVEQIERKVMKKQEARDDFQRANRV